MRSVRCDVCGTKALMAASQCPKCSHLFEVRDGFGELLPLAFCTSCRSYYPAHVGSCKWCGTIPEPVRQKPIPWMHITIGGLIATAWLGGVLLRDPQGKTHARNTAQARARSQSKTAGADDSLLQVVASTPTDTFVASQTIASAASVESPPPASIPDVPTAMPPDPVVLQGVRQPAAHPHHQSGPQLTAPFPPHSAAVPRSFEPAAPPPPAGPGVLRSKSRAGASWVSLVAKNWVVVRTGARKDAPIVASVGPDSRVQLGETRGTWRRIRSRDIVGWVDLRRSSFAEVRSTRTNGLAVR
jgi:hypothetical protein